MSEDNFRHLGMLGQMQAMISSSEFGQVGNIETRLPHLTRRLEKYDREAVLNAVGALMTVPQYHPNTVRLEALAHLAALCCNGRQRPSATKVREWLNDILGRDAAARMEDPSEDVFVANVVSGGGNARIFEGLLEANASHLQACLWAIKECAREGLEWAVHCQRQAAALLQLSDAIAKRSGVRRNATSGGSPRAWFQFGSSTLEAWTRRTRFSNDELQALGIHLFDLEPFNFNRVGRAALRSESLTWTSLERRPLLLGEAGVTVALPTAVSIAIRRRAAEMASEHGDTERFEHHLTHHQFHLQTLPSIEGLGVELAEQPSYDRTTRLGQVTGTFDDGSYLHVVFVQDSVDEFVRSGIATIHDVAPKVAAVATRRAFELAAKEGYRRGLTLVVYGGFGRGTQAGVNELPPDWRFSGIGNEDLSLIAWDHTMSALRIARLLQQAHELERRGMALVNANGLMNLIAYASSRDFELVPPEAGDQTLITLAPDFVSALRLRLRIALDRHAATAYDGEHFLEVQRQSTEALFEGLADQQLFVSATHFLNHDMLACVDTTARSWWVDATAHSPSDGGTLAYRIWDLARNWLARIAPILESRFATLPKGPIGVRLSLPELSTLSFETAGPAKDLGAPEILVSENAIVVSCPNAYLWAFSRAENLGDRLMVRTLIEGAARLAGAEIGHAEIVAMVDDVVPSGDARFVHVLTADLPGPMALSARLPQPRYLQDEVYAWINLGLAKELGDGLAEAGVIDASAAAKFAGDAVEYFWDLARQRLGELDRRSTIERAILNYDAIAKERMTWRHTAAALLHLNRDKDDVISTAFDLETRRAMAAIASRVVVEMAVCTSPVTGGRRCNLDDLDYLMACVISLIDFASRKDEQHFGFAEGQTRIMPNGTFVFPKSFALDIQVPYATAQGRKQFLVAADSYESFYERAEPVDEADHASKTDPIFEAAFEAEYGTSTLGMHNFLWTLTAAALDDKGSLVRRKRSELIAFAAEATDLEKAAAVVDALSLKPRPKWDERKPEGAVAKDWWPWRYSRRLSMSARPIIQLDLSDDPDCVVSVPMAENAFEYAMRSWMARLPESFFHSRQMRSWIGAAIDRLGHGFNAQVRDRMIEFGLEARAECLMTDLGGRAADGDVDVLAWDRETGTIFVMECKRLLMDRTIGDVAERLQEYRPDHIHTNGKRGPTRKHLDRLAVVRDNFDRLARVTGIAVSDMKVKSCLITHDLVPMQFQKETSAYFDFVADFGSLDAMVEISKQGRS